jgi:uncharacterized glyoxalase superfamily protein PhnB
MSAPISPTYRFDDAAAAIDMLERAYGFRRGDVHTDEEGRIQHAELWYGDACVMCGQSGAGSAAEFPNGSVYVVVEDADAHCAQAREAGAEIVMELRDTDYGSRDYAARGPEGTMWFFGTYAPSAAGAAPGSHQAAAR